MCGGSSIALTADSLAPCIGVASCRLLFLRQINATGYLYENRAAKSPYAAAGAGGSGQFDCWSCHRAANQYNFRSARPSESSDQEAGRQNEHRTPDRDCRDHDARCLHRPLARYEFGPGFAARAGGRRRQGRLREDQRDVRAGNTWDERCRVRQFSDQWCEAAGRCCDCGGEQP